VKSADQKRAFADQRHPVQAAIGLANDCGKYGKRSVVLLQKGKSRVDTIWTYGADLYPPPQSSLPKVDTLWRDHYRFSRATNSASSSGPVSSVIANIGSSTARTAPSGPRE
jgi:hypothetical protein